MGGRPLTPRGGAWNDAVDDEGGRTGSGDAEVRLEDAAVSRQHAIIALDSGRATIRDLGSQNGTHVDGVRVKGEAPVRSGAVITVCSTQLVFHGRVAGQLGRALDLDRFRAQLASEVERAAALERALAVV